jgi:hypothetical protein
MLKKIQRKSILRGLVVGAIFFVTFSAGANASYIQEETAAEIRRIATLSRPDPEGTPTKVSIAIYIIDLMAVDDLRQTFTADFFALVSWKDPRLALDPGDEPHAPRIFEADEIWHPQLMIINERNLDSYYDDIFRVDREGHVDFVQRYQGELTTNLALQDFPFDSQTLRIKMTSIRYTPEELELVMDEKRSGSRGTFSIPGWTVGPSRIEVTTEFLEVQDRHLARIDLVGIVKRHTGYYVIKALLPLLLIMFMAWAVFFIPPASLGPQIGIPTSSIFALFLFMHRISQLLPRISYLTRMDRFILGAITLVFITLGESIITSVLAIQGKEVQARKIDRWSRGIYLILFLIVLIYAFAI